MLDSGIIQAHEQGRIEEFWFVGGGVKVGGWDPHQPTSETYILKSFLSQIQLLLDTLNLDFYLDFFG